MTWRTLLLASSFFSAVKPGGNPLIPSVNTTPLSEKLSKYNVSMNPLVEASSDFIRDTQFNPIERERQVGLSTRNMLSTLQNPEIFCILIYILTMESCDKSGNLVSFKIQAASSINGYAAGFIYSPQQINTILIGTTNLVPPDRLKYIEQHEFRHAFWNTFNVAQCTNKHSKRINKRFLNTKLAANEKTSAPYNSANKDFFAYSLFGGIARLADLKELANNLTQAPTPNQLMIKCYEEEAKKTPLAKSSPFSNSSISPLLQLLNSFSNEINLTTTYYSSLDRKIYELEATIYGMLVDYPALLNDNFSNMRLLEAKKVPSHIQCINQIEPSRLTATCRKS